MVILYSKHDEVIINSLHDRSVNTVFSYNTKIKMEIVNFFYEKYNFQHANVITKNV